MVKVYITDFIVGNDYRNTIVTFDSLNEVINWLLSDEWRLFEYRVTKNGTNTIIEKSDFPKVFFCKDNRRDTFNLYISTYDNYIYGKKINRIDVDGICILNKETKLEALCETTYVVTNTFMKTLFEPLLDKWKKSLRITYAD